MGVDYSTKVIPIGVNKRKVNVGFWDLSGQQRYLSLMRTYFTDKKIFVMFYDLTNQEHLSAIYNYLELIGN
jgi:GTPase SAR1 family protein